MARLVPGERAKLSDKAFAYIDSEGRRRLPIHDEAHVRNALARFNQVVFEDEAARDRARRRLLNAAKRNGIVPVGFITGQFRTERELGRTQRRPPSPLPAGVLTLMMTDVEGSTGLVDSFGADYGHLITSLRRLLRKPVAAFGGHVVEVRADELFAVFKEPRAAIETALVMQQQLGDRVWGANVRVRVRIGLHTGRPTKREGNYIGMAVHTAARICAAAHGGQIVTSETTKAAVERAGLSVIGFRSLGSHLLRGLREPLALYQVQAEGLHSNYPPLRLSPPG